MVRGVRRIGVVAASALLMVSALAAPAIAEQPDEFPEPARGPVVDVGKAPIIVIGTAGASRTVAGPNGTIDTLTTFDVEKSPRGRVPSQIVIRTSGGTLGGQTQVTDHEPLFAAGERSRLFLEEAGAEYRVVGAEEGKQDARRSRDDDHAVKSSTANEETASSDLTGCGYGYCFTGQQWDSFPVTYRINANTADVTGEDEAVAAAFATWENDAGSSVDFTRGSATSGSSVARDSVNSVFWGSPNANYLAQATWWFSGSTTVEFDIQYNDGHAWATTATSGRYDIQSVGLHEAGHILGLDHVTDSTQVMNPTIGAGVLKRALYAGDTEGIGKLYPAESTSTDTTPTPTVAVGDVNITEGDARVRVAYFPVTLSAPSTLPVSVSYVTSEGTADVSADYTAASGTLSFAAGQVNRVVGVAIKGDRLDEPLENFTVRLSSPVNATVSDGVGVGKIRDDDPQSGPKITISDVIGREGDSGGRVLYFTVSLSAPVSETVTVNFATRESSAKETSDYVPRSGTVTFDPGVLTQRVAIPTKADTDVESNESFAVRLSGATGPASITDAVGVGTLRNDDA